jgi:hypothetical protein
MNEPHQIIDRQGDGWSYRMEYRAEPPHVLVSLRGVGSNALVQAYYSDIIDFMDPIVGAMKPFLPIIFDATVVEVGQVNLAVIWKSPQQVPRRVTRIVVVYPIDRGGLISSFIRTLASVFPGLSAAATMDEAMNIITPPRSFRP